MFDVVVHRSNFMFFVLLPSVSDTATMSVFMRKRMMVILFFFRSQGKEEEAERMLKESIRFGPHFADAYSSLASLYADQVLLSARFSK